MTNSTISPLEAFRKAFPWLKVVSDGEGLRCYFDDALPAGWVEARVHEAIIRDHLAITAELEIWQSCRRIREISLIIRPVPEEYTFADEVPDTEDYQEERAEWEQE